MAQGADYKIKKLEKGPLQRFKNQNLLIKKYGEIGLQIYKAITGKRTTHELRKDLGIEEELFDKIVNYMQDAGMIELEPAAAEPKKRKPSVHEEAPEEPGTVPIQEIKSEEDISLEELPEEEEEEEEIAPLEEEPVEELEEEAPPEEEEEEAEIEPFEFEEIKPLDEHGEAVEEEPEKEEPEKEEPEKEEPEEEYPPEEEAPPEEEEEISISALEEEGY